MFGWLRHIGDRIAYQTPPHEPPADQRLPRDRARLIAHYDQAIAWNAEAGDWQAVDDLLDERNRIRPPATVPGRIDSIIDNYWENP